jgi:hypothetical protein
LFTTPGELTVNAASAVTVMEPELLMVIVPELLIVRHV